MGKVAMSIDNKLRDAFTPLRLAIEDESSRHHGHAGWREGGETHFRVEIVSAAFEGKRLIGRHQLVYATLGERMKTDEVHALSMKTFTPAEWVAQQA